MHAIAYFQHDWLNFGSCVSAGLSNETICYHCLKFWAELVCRSMALYKIKRRPRNVCASTSFHTDVCNLLFTVVIKVYKQHRLQTKGFQGSGRTSWSGQMVLSKHERRLNQITMYDIKNRVQTNVFQRCRWAVY